MDDEARTLLAELVSIDSVNPRLVPGGAGEAEIARFVGHWLEQRGLEVNVADVEPGRPNVIARARGRAGGRTLLLYAHMDVVGVDGMADPFRPRVDGDRLYGRGAYDMKAGLAAIMVSCRTCARPRPGRRRCDRRRLRRGVRLGTAALAAAEMVLPMRPSWRSQPARRSLSLSRTRASLAPHRRSRPRRPRLTSAGGHRRDRTGMGHVLVALDRLLADQLAAGEATRCSAGARCTPRSSKVVASSPAIPAAAPSSSSGARYRARPSRRSRPSCQPCWTRSPQAVRRLTPSCTRRSSASRSRSTATSRSCEPRCDALGAETPVIGVPYWAESAIFAAAGIPTVIFGPGGAGAHADVEWVDLGQFDRCVAALGEVVDGFCG